MATIEGLEQLAIDYRNMEQKVGAIKDVIQWGNDNRLASAAIVFYSNDNHKRIIELPEYKYLDFLQQLDIWANTEFKASQDKVSKMGL